MLTTIDGLVRAIPGLRKNTIYAWSRAGEIPFINIGVKRLYDVEQIQSWLQERALNNVKREVELSGTASSYGTLRRINTGG